MKEGKITSNQRIVAALDTVKYVLGKNAKSVVSMQAGSAARYKLCYVIMNKYFMVQC